VRTRIPPLEEQKATLLAFCRKMAPKITLVGHAAEGLGWWATLPKTEDLLEGLVVEGLIRRATKEELAKQGLRHGYLPV
jgi:hypothetical protein